MFGLSEDKLVVAQFITVVLGQTLIVIGALLAIFGWRQLHAAVKRGEMATRGLYRYIRHPQYTGFFLFLIGSVINWPTICNGSNFAGVVLRVLATCQHGRNRFTNNVGDAYDQYARRTGKFLPRLLPIG